MPTLESDIEGAVRARYSAGARSLQADLCCPVQYDRRLLEAIPREVLERDYGCGDPSRYLRPGETVLDLGSGGGKIAFIAAQIVGAEGRVIGVDMNDDMLGLARRAQKQVAGALGYDNVTFRKGRIQDLGLDLEAVEGWLGKHPAADGAGYEALQAEIRRLRREEPLIPDASVDVVVSNCVLNLVAAEEKRALFSEIHRVLRRGGRAVISDIVSDQEVPLALQRDPELWSGCLSGAYEGEAFLRAFEEAGFHGITLDKRDPEPWRVVDGISFRSVTVLAYKGKQGPCWDHGQAVLYKGPWKRVEDDDGHVFERGVSTAVCLKTFELMGREPYAGQLERLEPRQEPVDIQPFPCGAGALRRDPQTLRGTQGDSACAAPGCC